MPAEKSIDYRPEGANDRSEYGHWEGDLVVGKEGKGSALLTFTERKNENANRLIRRFIPKGTSHNRYIRRIYKGNRELDK